MADAPIAEVIEELRRLLDAATPGPWDDGKIQHFTERGSHVLLPVVQSGAYEDERPIIAGGDPMDWPMSEEDAELIAAARNHLPALLDHIATLTSDLESVKAWADRAAENYRVQHAEISEQLDHLKRELAAVRSEGPLQKPRMGGGVVD